MHRTEAYQIIPGWENARTVDLFGADLDGSQIGETIEQLEVDFKETLGIIPKSRNAEGFRSLNGGKFTIVFGLNARDWTIESDSERKYFSVRWDFPEDIIIPGENIGKRIQETIFIYNPNRTSEERPVIIVTFMDKFLDPTDKNGLRIRSVDSTDKALEEARRVLRMLQSEIPPTQPIKDQPRLFSNVV